jgi:hypothetical protein
MEGHGEKQGQRRLLKPGLSKEVPLHAHPHIITLLLLFMLNSGCCLSKLVSVPKRVTGAALSVIPIAGNTAHDSIDEAADVVDDIPL